MTLGSTVTPAVVAPDVNQDECVGVCLSLEVAEGVEVHQLVHVVELERETHRLPVSVLVTSDPAACERRSRTIMQSTAEHEHVSTRPQ